MPYLKIVKCPDPMRWYSGLIGETVDLFGDTGTEYRSSEPSGLFNFVQYDDAKIVMTHEEWLDKNANLLDCEAAETGMDRELDFDRERWEEEKYLEYIQAI